MCKLFDIFTRFSVGLVYLMYRAFERVALFKPVTSRPANSERYIICQSKRSDSMPIQQYLFSLNKRMCHIWPGVSHSNIDIQEVVPYDILRQDDPFFRYIYNSNMSIGEQQIIGLVKIQTFARNTELRETRQADIRKMCLEKWQIPDELRTAPDKTEKPLARFQSLTKDNIADYQLEPVHLTSKLLHEKIKSVFDYRCVIAGAELQFYVISLGRSHVFQWDGKSAGKWLKVDVKLELPKDTILEVEFVQELRGEGKGQRRVMAMHVVDALFICNTDVRQLHYSERIEKAKKFVKAISRPTRSDLAPIRVKEPVRFEQVETLFPSLQMKMIKGSGQIRKLCYCCHEDEEHSRYILPAGLLLIRIVNEPWMMAMSRSQNRKYYYHTVTHNSLFETPKESISSYIQCKKSRIFWQWNDSVKLIDDQQSDKHAAVTETVSKDHLIHFVHEKLGRPS